MNGASPEAITVQWVVAGRVQGVGFRWYTARLAERLQICGWVRNLPDGRVEVVARGRRAALAEMEAGIRSGPKMSRVDSVENAEILHDINISNSFHIR